MTSVPPPDSGDIVLSQFELLTKQSLSGWARVQGLSLIEFTVLSHFVAACDARLETRVSLPVLRYRLGMSRRTLFRALLALRDRGLLEIRTQPGGPAIYKIRGYP